MCSSLSPDPILGSIASGTQIHHWDWSDRLFEFQLNVSGMKIIQQSKTPKWIDDKDESMDQHDHSNDQLNEEQNDKEVNTQNAAD